MKALILAENVEKAKGLAAGARTFADEVIVVEFGDAKLTEGIADTVVHIDMPDCAVLDDAADTVISVFDAKSPNIVLAEPSRHIKTLVGRLAFYKKTAVITDALSLEGTRATTMYFGGVAVCTLEPEGAAIYTVEPEVFGDAAPFGANTLEEAAWVAPAKPMKLLSSKPVEKSDVDLTQATTVVAAGRGFAEKEDLELARALCSKIDAGLGCTRPLTEGVDWLPTEVYIGVSGLMLSPKVYVACGISGQMQHMVGCNRSTIIFAINKDANAPIFKQCDYGLVGDIKAVLPALASIL